MNWSLFLNKRGGGGGGLVNKRGGKSAESELFGTQVARVPEAEYAHA